MKALSDTISAILERELAKLDFLSRESPEPLPSAEVRSLDLLIKAAKSYLDPSPAADPSQPGGSASPAQQDTAALLQGIHASKEPIR